MPPELLRLLEDIRTRNLTAGGIATAEWYLKQVSGCFTGDFCPVSAFGDETAPLWAKELELAGQRLTYAEQQTKDAIAAVVKSISESDISDGFILKYDTVLTTKAVDRDGDIVEPIGLNIDPNAPLLWNHAQLQPIGKMLAVKEQNEDHAVVTCGIADTTLGRDAAVLTKAGALRTSHGFKAGDFSPRQIIKGSDGQERVAGWHIKTGDTMEVSRVSIPANPGAVDVALYEKSFEQELDAVRTEFGRKSLHHPVVLAWAQKHYDARPTKTQVVLDTKSHDGAAAEADDKKSLDLESTQHKAAAESAGGSGDTAAAGTTAECPKCQAGMKSGKCTSADCGYSHSKADKSAAPGSTKLLATKRLDDALTTKMHLSTDDIPGSFENLKKQLSKSADAYLKAKGKVEREPDYSYVFATFPGEALVCCRSYGSDKKCFKIAYTTNADGKPEWSGEPAEVTVAPAITAKMAEEFDLLHKQANPSLLRDAREFIVKSLDLDADSVEAAKALAEIAEAHGAATQFTVDRDALAMAPALADLSSPAR